MDHDEFVNKRVVGIARSLGCTVDEVNAALDRHPIEVDRDAYLRRTLALELIRLDQYEMAFGQKALVDRDVAAGVLMVKIAERRATLLGLNAPLGHAVHVVQHRPAHHETSTDKISHALLVALNWRWMWTGMVRNSDKGQSERVTGSRSTAGAA